MGQASMLLLLLYTCTCLLHLLPCAALARCDVVQRVAALWLLCLDYVQAAVKIHVIFALQLAWRCTKQQHG
jgi:hypothetical protein